MEMLIKFFFVVIVSGLTYRFLKKQGMGVDLFGWILGTGLSFFAIELFRYLY